MEWNSSYVGDLLYSATPSQIGSQGIQRKAAQLLLHSLPLRHFSQGAHIAYYLLVCLHTRL